jgi:hypothetical protein
MCLTGENLLTDVAPISRTVTISKDGVGCRIVAKMTAAEI